MVAFASAVLVAALLLPGSVGAQWPLPTGPRARAGLDDGDASVRAAAARTLGYYGAPRAAVDALVAALPTERDVVVRRSMISALARRGEPSAVPALIEALAAAGTSNRALAAHALGSFPTEATVRALTEALEDEEVEGAARRSLVRLGPRAVPHLILEVRERPASRAAVVVLGEVRDQRAVPALVGLLSDERVSVRVATLTALTTMGAERAGPSIVGLLDDESLEVRLAAITALGVLGGPPHVDLLAALIAQDGQDGQDGQDVVLVQRAALQALVTLSPDRAVAHLERLAADGNPELGPLAVDLVLGLRTAGAAPLLHGLLTEGSRSEEAASALAELEGGAGLAVLVHAAHGQPPESGVLRAVAVCLRRYARTVEDHVASAGYRALAARGGNRALLLRAIAHDDSVHELLVPRLGSDVPGDRAVAALAAEVHPSPALAEALMAALADEEDAEAFRRIAGALLMHGASVDRLDRLGQLGRLTLRFEDTDVAPEAMLLAADAYGDADRWTQRRLGRALRRALRSPDPRVRTGAAWALARAGDTGARRALAAALDDPAQEVRHGAARALSSLGAGNVAAAVMRRYRVEEDEHVAQALLDVVRTRRAFPAHGLLGDQVLRIRIVPSGGIMSGGIPVDVVLPDGRYLRMRTLSTGELLLVDLPAGTADVRVRVGDAP
ncbi:MAG: HEAT repeat domain-containing protein [Deltaproteobacteria bacterium]|nr:HEAT repeat domain-containing protein [Deltaproteobacteria bacterium]